MTPINRRDFLKAAGIAGATIGLGGSLRISSAVEQATRKAMIDAKADAMVMIYLPGGCAQRDLWDVKKHTPFEKGMKGSELFGTCPAIPTKADGIQLGA